MTKKLLWKFLREENGKVKSNHGNVSWKVGEWKHEDVVDICNSGFHASKKISQAFSYVQGEILAQVEVKGTKEVQDDKEVWSDMRIINAYKWQKKDSVALSIYAAELCIENYEKVYPDDKRPREAIEAAKNWLLDPSKKNESAAWSAAEAAESAAEAAWSAAESAAEAAWSAAEAAWSAAEAAESAAWSAAEAAESAAEAAWSAKKKITTAISKWFDKRVKELEIYE